MSLAPDWPARFELFLQQQPQGDAAHGLEHVRRVVANATHLARQEGADLVVVIPAAWLHDCVTVAKDSAGRSGASQLAARAAVEFLAGSGYPAATLPAIQHAIEAHSFTANIPPRTLEAQVVQDADRLDALGAVGIARCLMLGGAAGLPLYHPGEPLPRIRPPDERAYTIDHFYTKLLRLAERMNTAAGRAEAQRRTAVMEQFLAQLEAEVRGEWAGW